MTKFIFKSSIAIFLVMIFSIIFFAISYFIFSDGSQATIVVNQNNFENKNSAENELNSDINDWRIYRNLNLGFELKYPAEWLAREGDWNQKVDLLFDSRDNTVVSGYVYVRNTDSDEEDSLQESVKESVLNYEPGIIGVVRISNSIIKNDSNGVGYLSKWKLYFLNSKGQKVYKIHVRGDFESDDKIIKRNDGSYKTVYSFILNSASQSQEIIFARIFSTFEIF